MQNCSDTIIPKLSELEFQGGVAKFTPKILKSKSKTKSWLGGYRPVNFPIFRKFLHFKTEINSWERLANFKMFLHDTLAHFVYFLPRKIVEIHNFFKRMKDKFYDFFSRSIDKFHDLFSVDKFLLQQTDKLKGDSVLIFLKKFKVFVP